MCDMKKTRYEMRVIPLRLDMMARGYRLIMARLNCGCHAVKVVRAISGAIKWIAGVGLGRS